MKKIAFLFLTINDLHNYFLWDKFFTSADPAKYTIYCHPLYPNEVTQRIVKENTIQKHINAGWGDIKAVKAWLYLLRSAYEDIENYKFIFLSESNVPLHSFNHIWRTLVADDKIYMNWGTGNRKRFSDLIAEGRIMESNVYKSSNWLVLNRSSCKTLIDTRRHYLTLLKDIRHIDEHYFNIVLLLESNSDIISHSSGIIQYSNWSKGDRSHPKTYYHRDAFFSNSESIERIKSKYLFMRKIVLQDLIAKDEEKYIKLFLSNAVYL